MPAPLNRGLTRVRFAELPAWFCRLFWRRGSAEFRSGIEQAATQHPELKELSGELEKTFLEVGSGLEKLSEGSSRLLASCEALRDLQSGEQDAQAILRPVVELLNAPLDFLSHCDECLQSTTDQMRTADRQIEGLILSSADIQRALAPLACIQVLFFMETVRLPEEVRQGFAALPEEIGRLRLRLLETFSLRLEALAQTRRTMQQGVARLEQVMAEHRRTVQTQTSKVQETLASLQNDLSSTHSRDTGLARVSRSISEQVGQIVMGLQSQDIISQRLAHVLEALTKLESRYQVARQQNHSKALGEIALYASQAAKLQAGQLQGIVTEAVKAEQVIQTGLGSILDSISELERACAQRVAGKAEQLTALIEALRDPLAVTQQRTAMVCDLIASLGGQATDVTVVMRELAGSIWLSGLNAQVLSAQLSHGTGLDVLSAQVSAIARQTREVASKVGSEVDALAHNLNAVVAGLRELRDQAASHLASLSSRSEQHHEQSNARHQNAQTKTSEVGNLASQVRQLATKVLERGRFAETFTANVTATTDALQKLHRLGEVLAQKLNCTSLPESLQKELKGNYTMAAEVLVHQTALSKPSSAAEENSTTADVELFDGPASPTEFTDDATPRVNNPDGKLLPTNEDSVDLNRALKTQPAVLSAENNVELF